MSAISSRIAWTPGRFIDAEERAKRHPLTFGIPDRGERNAIHAGCLVKLGFLIDRQANGLEGERMWVKVTGREGLEYLGELDNDPAFLDVERGAVVRFEPRHVMAIEEGGN